MILIKDINNKNYSKFLTNADYSYLHMKEFASYILNNKYGFIIVNDVNNTYQYAMYVDIGKLLKVNSYNNLLKYVELEDKSSFRKIYDFTIKHIYNVCPNTFLMFTNMMFNDYFNGDTPVQKVLNSYPCYNVIHFHVDKIDQNILNESNLSRTYKYESHVKGKDFEWKYDYCEDLEVTNDIFALSISKNPDLIEVYDDFRNKTVPIILPPGSPLEQLPKYKGTYKEVILKGFEITENSNNIYFVSNPLSEVTVHLFKEVEFTDFFDMEINLNLLEVYETVRSYYIDNEYFQALFFYSFNNEDYLYPQVKENNTIDRVYEDKMVADIYSIIPMMYEDYELIEKLQSNDNNFIVNNVLTGLEFQDNYEFGNDNKTITKYSERISRFDLGTFNVLLTEQPHYNYYKKNKTEIIAVKPMPIRVIAALDEETHTAVIHLLHFGVKNKPSKYIDEISRNGIYLEYNENDEIMKKLPKRVSDDDTLMINFNDYLKAKYKIHQVGMPRHLILSPFLDDEEEFLKNVPTDKQDKIKDNYKSIKSSLLYAESMFEEGEELGDIIDSSLDIMYKKEYGLSFYDYSKTYISKTTLLQYFKTYKDYLPERIDFAVVNLFYLELLQFETAAHDIANQRITKFLKEYDIDAGKKKNNNKLLKMDSDSVLDTIDDIQEEYTKTLDFWEIQANYYSSKKFLNIMRKRFEIDEQMKMTQRNQDAINKIYSTKKSKKAEKADKIIGWVGIFFTIFNVLDIFIASADDTSSHMTDFERIIFNNLTSLTAFRIFLAFAVLFFSVKLIIKHQNSKRVKD